MDLRASDRAAGVGAVRRVAGRGPDPPVRHGRRRRCCGSCWCAAGSDEHRLVLTNHHILLDGWSTPLLLQELLDPLRHRRRRLRAAAGAPVPRLPRLARRAGPAGVAARVGRRPGRARRADPARAGSGATASSPPSPDVLARRWTRPATDALRALGARARAVTLNTVVQAAWAIVLGTAHRPRRRRVRRHGVRAAAALPGIESMIGLFINTLPVRVALDPRETLGELLDRVQAEQAALLDHHHVGLTDIQHAAGTGCRRSTRSPCSSPTRSTGELSRGRRHRGDAAARHRRPRRRPLPAERGRDRRPTGCALTLNSCPDLLDRDRGRGPAARRLLHVLRAIVDDPRAAPGRLDLLDRGRAGGAGAGAGTSARRRRGRCRRSSPPPPPRTRTRSRWSPAAREMTYADLDDAVQPAGAGADRRTVSGRKRSSRWDVRGRSNRSSRCGRSPRPGPRSCRSTRTTRPNGSQHMLADSGAGRRAHRHRAPATGCPTRVPWLTLDDPGFAARLRGRLGGAGHRRRPHGAAAARPSGLPDLHLRLHRHAQGRRRHPSRPGELRRGAAGRAAR